jgi:hypothetical protein
MHKLVTFVRNLDEYRPCSLPEVPAGKRHPFLPVSVPMYHFSPIYTFFIAIRYIKTKTCRISLGIMYVPGHEQEQRP